VVRGWKLRRKKESRSQVWQTPRRRSPARSDWPADERDALPPRRNGPRQEENRNRFADGHHRGVFGAELACGAVNHTYTPGGNCRKRISRAHSSQVKSHHNLCYLRLSYEDSRKDLNVQIGYDIYPLRSFERNKYASLWRTRLHCVFDGRDELPRSDGPTQKAGRLQNLKAHGRFLLRAAREQGI